MEYVVILVMLLALAWPHFSLAAASPVAPPLMLAKTFESGIDVSAYFVSEKLDGVRAYWNGRQLLTRSGRQIRAPAWFLASLPDDTPLDGELWAGRGEFAFVSGLIRRHKAEDDDWLRVKYMAFDLPQLAAPYSERLWVLRTLIAQQKSPSLKALEQTRISGEQELQQRLQQITAGGGEGLMLRRAASLYQAKRSDDLLKLKLVQDDEAVVVGHVPGEGKYLGAMGSLLVRMDDGREFCIGTGFSDDERDHPPARGTRITFSYNGLTEHGLPRFARFVRIRPAE